MPRLFLTHKRRPELNLEVLSFDKDTHVLVGRRPDGSIFTDPNFWPVIVKRCGYSLTHERPNNIKE